MEKQPRPKVLILISDHNPRPELKELPQQIKSKNAEKLKQFGLIPIFAASHMSIDEQDHLYSQASGILLPGGTDVDPAQYGETPKGPMMVVDQPLDAMQIRLTKKTLEDKKPLLGICRGAQILAVACGGKLIQHLPDVTEEKHGVSIDAHDTEYPSSVYHEIQIKSGTKAAHIFPLENVSVPSRHHQAIDHNHTGSLTVSAMSPGGIVEMVEHPDQPFHIGIQSHPELVDTMDFLFTAFANAVNSYEATASNTSFATAA
jgi:putative glutamine amidotransferase